MNGPETRQGAEGFSFDPPAAAQGGTGSTSGAVESWTPGDEPAEATPAGAGHAADEDAVIAAIASVYDPEIPVNIYELGLIYAIDLHQDGGVHIEMTLTAPNCPSAQELPMQVQEAVGKVDGVTRAEVEIVWDPPWDMSRMSDDARLTLNMF
ncbi:metal-sulfur cluster biosynthetic enzyme [Gluconacetobacter johannae DSM 13595]|uniref:SUF system Fe-S cluster assembly protein n=1 Tax=Gluconacetobacter johannae TaxID=112140 RepID=A0A7W4J748_9PROT|nr:SUF system Fe-S cluster assembly protein [Gluconacetobacter johannae]MBB2175930.1 SUF system Fe-S cluster assembly protein [Gluconacetobacter johannae]GBQ83396.1 metal-sulfur cluster biosynthetic enzyme [Gluconacetobacter johannae DSM 13595]